MNMCCIDCERQEYKGTRGKGKMYLVKSNEELEYLQISFMNTHFTAIKGRSTDNLIFLS